MTILSKKKGNSSKGSGEVDPGDHGGPHVHSHAHNLSHSHAHPMSLQHPHGQIQAESLSSERLYGNERSSGSQLWSQSHSQSHGVSSTREEKRASQSHPHQYESMETVTSHPLVKRRHRASPIRCPTRPKQSRLERDRTSTSSPSGSILPSLNVAVSTPEPSPAICNLPRASSPEASYNSEDEYEARREELTDEEWAERERRFEKKMRKKGFIIKKMAEDGACLFRAVSDQVYGDQEMHAVVRKHCIDYIAANADYFSQYVTEDFNSYISRKRMDYVHGNHIEIQAMSEMYNRTIEVFCYSSDPINTFPTQGTDNESIRLSYHRGIHYNSLVNPYKATIGVGLGLPGHMPGLADKNVVKEATRQSEDLLIEQAMLEDKLRATDWEATNEALEEQVARESYLQWLKDNERRNRSVRSPTASSSSATVTCASTCSEIRSPRHRSHGSTNISPLGSPYRTEPSYKNSPNRHSPPPSIPGPSKTLNPTPPRSPIGNPGGAEPFQLLETSSFINQLPPELFGFNEWEDAGYLAQVLAASQQEYLDALKRHRENSPPPQSQGQKEETSFQQA